MAGRASANQAIDVLRMNERDRETLTRELNSGRREVKGSDLRENQRVAYELAHGVVMELQQPGGNTSRYMVQPRDISCTGLGFLHGSFVYTDSVCTCELVTIDGSQMPIRGKIVRCRHVKGRVHEVGVHFDDPLAPTVFAKCFIPSVPGEPGAAAMTLEGDVVCIEPSTADRELLRFRMSDVGVTIHGVQFGVEGLKLLETLPKVHAVITELDLPGMSGLDVVAKFRKEGFFGPIFGVTSNDDPAAAAEARRCGCTEVFVKPYDFDELVVELAEHLPKDRSMESSSPLESELWANERMRPLITSFIAEMAKQIELLREAVVQSDQKQALQIAKSLKGTSGNFGYPDIVKIAKSFSEMVEAGGFGDAVNAKLDVMQLLCERAAMVRS